MLKSLASLMSSNIFRQVLALVSVAITFKYYELDMIGESAFLLSITAILSIVSTLRLEQAIFSVNKGRHFELFVVVIGVNIFFVLGVYLLMTAIGMDGFTISLLLLLSGLSNILIKIANFHGRYYLMSIYEVLKALTLLGGIYIMRDVNLSIINALILSHILAWFFSALFLAISLMRNLEIVKCNLMSLKKLVLELKDFYTHGLSGAIANKIYNEAPILAVGYLFDDSATAIVSGAKKLISGPLGIFSTSLSYLYSRQFLKTRTLNKNLYYLPILVASMLVIGGVLAPVELFDLLFNVNGELVRNAFLAFLPLLFGRTAAVPVATFYQVFRQQKYLARIQYSNVVCYCATLFIMGLEWSLDEVIFVSSIIAAVHYLYITMDVYKRSTQ